MKAAWIEAHGAMDGVRVGTFSDPACGAGEVLVRIRAASLNHRDVYVVRGEAGRFPLPLVLGSDGVGTVIHGAAEAGLQPDSRVVVYPVVHCGSCPHCVRGWEHKCFSFGMVGGERPGTLAERVSLPARNCLPAPDSLPDHVAGSVSVAGLTAWNMIHEEGAIEPGHRVLILGASGGVGVYAIRFLKHLGATVYAVTSKPDKSDFLREMGADVVLSGGPATVLMATGRLPYKGVDAAINFVGGDTWRYVLPAVRRGGAILTCGAVGGAVAEMDQRQIFYRQLRILGCSMGSRAGFSRMLDCLAGHPEMHLPETEEIPLERVPEALRRMEQGGLRGKIVIRP